MTKNGKVQAMKKTLLALAAASTMVVPTAPVEARHHYRHATARHYYTTSNGIRYWRGNDGRYYCRRSNGTTGLIIGAAGGALVGRVIDAGGSFAHALLINDTGSTVVGQLSTSRATGEVVGQLGGVLVMRNIDATEKIQLGDEVVTAGIELAGGIRSPFPKGLVLGQVVDVSRASNDVVQTAFLDPAADLDRLEYVLVITNYDGGLPSADDQPTVCGGGPDNTLPEGENPCYTPGPSATATTRPAATPTRKP
jgi:hypothetical protein